MTKAFTGLLGATAALLVLALPLRAAEAPSKEPTTYAVLIGAGTFSDKAIQNRAHAEDDVKALYDLFTDAKYLGAPKDHVKLLLGGAADKDRHSEEASRANILKDLAWVAKQAKHDDLVLIAFIGQGAALGERGDRVAYFATDSSVKDPAKTAVLATAIGEDLDKLQSHRVCLFVDVYFKGYKPANGKAPPDPNVAAGSFFKEFFGKDSTEEEAPAPGRALFVASSTGRFHSPDGKEHGSFTEVVLDGLKGKADKDGYEPDGVVTVDELADYLKAKLPALVKKMVANEKERPGYGVVLGEDANFVLTRDPAVEVKVKERLDKFAAIAKDNKLSPEVREEGKALLSRMPKLESQRTLRKEYQALTDGKEPVDKFLANRNKLVEGMKITHKAARDFAETVLDAIELVKDKYVKEVNKGQLVEWAVRGLYRSLDMSVPDDVAKKLGGAKSMSNRELRELLTDVRERLGKREDLDNHKDIDDALLRMLRHLDPYTTFYTPDELRHLEADVSGEFIGVGIQIRRDADTDELQVITPIYGSPAFKAGIQTGDLVTSITRLVDDTGKPLEKPEVIPTKGLSVNDAVKKIAGLPGSKVRLTVKRKGVDKPIDVDMERQPIATESVFGYKRNVDASWDYWVDPKEKIAYIRLFQFQRNSTHDLVETMAKLKDEGVQGLVFDLRFNPGGYLDSGRDITDLFIDDGVIVEIRPRKGDAYALRGSRTGTYRYEVPGTDDAEEKPLPSYTDFPMVVLVNGLSASASEIVSAALQDHHRAYVMGERSYGKGSVQQIFNFEKDPAKKKVLSKIKVTNASFWRPSGKNLNKSSTQGRPEDEWGVIPDKVVPLEQSERFELSEHLRDAEIIRPKSANTVEEKKDTFKDKQLDAALEYLRGQMKLSKKL
ncbi:MAG TPA: S41 family peptidase, partial [Gemmataceae bacterium]|nr:S41 family peptidase [Gemmataceae bacterium]